MKTSPRLLVALGALLLTGCRMATWLVVVPVVIVGTVAVGITSILVRADGFSDAEELGLAGLRVDRHSVEITVAEDLTFGGTLLVETTVVSQAGLKHAQETSLSFDPRSQELELVLAEVVEPDGSVVVVKPEQVFLRPSTMAQGSPGFVSSMTKSVLFPQLRVGSQTRARWRFKETAPSALGFNFSWRPLFTVPVEEARFLIRYDADVPLQFAADAPFVVQEGTEGGQKFLDITLQGYERQIVERAMVSPRDLCPEFVVTTQDSWEAIGAAFHAAVSDRVEVTPSIEALAAEIVGPLEGIDAARAIHRWICRDVQYMVVELNQMDGWVPHSASEIAENLYGDCKDKFVLSASLLAARGIHAEPVLVKFDRGFEPLALPSPLQFDHCMAYLPDFDLYSNPTDPYRDLGELDVSLSGKFVVIGTPNGRVARTPEGSADVNRYSVSHEVAIGSDGIVSGRSEMDFAGRTSGMLRRTLASSDDMSLTADHLLHAGVIGGHGDLITTDPSDLDTPLHCEGTWASDIPLAVGNSVHFTTPVGIDCVNPQFIREFLSGRERLHAMVAAAIELNWHYEIQLPSGYVIDAPPKGRSKQTSAGRFESRYRIEESGKLIVDRVLRLEQDRYSAEEYSELREILIESEIDMQTVLTALFQN